MEHLRDLWTLDPDVIFLNHGSFGACPSPVLQAQSELRARMEREPVRFFVRELEQLLDEARCALAAFVGADPAGLAFVPNATAGVNTALRSLRLAPLDEVLVTDHEYNACRNACNEVAGAAGARVVVVPLPFPLTTPDAIVDAVLAQVTSRTRLLLIDHITSPTALVLPVERLVPALRERGVETLVDGAHAPGSVPLALDSLGAAYYTGNCHKWLCAPKGAGFLWTRADLRPSVRPLVISHGANAVLAGRSRYRVEFDWTGTQDPTPWLCVPHAISTLGGLLPGGFPELMARNHALALEGRAIVGRALGVAPPCPDAMVGCMATLPLPPRPGGDTTPLAVEPLQDALMDRHRIEIPVSPWPALPHRSVRLSAQVYNERAEYEALARALAVELGRELAQELRA